MSTFGSVAPGPRRATRRAGRPGAAVALAHSRNSHVFWIGAIGMALAASLALFGCEKGPAQEAGEKIDSITDQDRIIGKGPAEKAGKDLDKAVDNLKR
jgi:hypothetical protein